MAYGMQMVSTTTTPRAGVGVLHTVWRLFFFFFELFPKRMNVKKKQVVEAIEKKGKLARWDVYIRFILE